MTSHDSTTAAASFLSEKWRENDVRRRNIDVTGQIEAQDEQPELFLLASVPRVGYLVVTILVPRKHPNWNRFGRYDAQI